MFQTGNLAGPDPIQAPFEAFSAAQGTTGTELRISADAKTTETNFQVTDETSQPAKCATQALARPGARLQRGAVKRCPPTEAQMFSVIKLTLNILWRVFATREGEPEEPRLTGRESTGWRRCISKPPHLELD